MSFPNFSDYNITVIGDIMLDEYWHGNVERISPEAPVPIVDIKEKSYRIGGAGNVAMNIAALGISTRLISSIGTDSESVIVKKILKKNKISDSFQISKNKKTIKKLRVLSKNHQMIRLDFEENKRSYTLKSNKSFTKQIKDSDVVIFSDYDKGSLLNIQNFIEISNKLKKIIVIDPKGNDFNRYKNATILTPNLKEFENIVGKLKSHSQLIIKGKKLIKELNLDALLVTRGNKGMTLIKNNQHFELKAIAEEVYDVTGAGDTVVALIASCLAAGLDLSTSADYANKAASLVVKKIGTSVINLNELKNILNIQ
jgi:D-beta-D-heptose 7-phosphate kinase/D-beta-D-heptose 1-phosphate adenosyltransferase